MQKQQTSKPVRHRNLTAKQEKFCQLFVSGLSATDAYREAYSVKPSVKESSVWTMASTLKAKPWIQARIDELTEKLAADNQVTLEEVLIEMSAWLRFDPIEMMDENNSVKNMHELPPNVRKSIASFEVVELHEKIDGSREKIGEIKKIKLIDKRAVADQFMRKFGAYLDKKELTVKNLDHIKEVLGGLNLKH